MPELILLSGKRAGKQLRLPAGDVVVGRDEDCKMRLTSNDVSRRHCVLTCAADGVTVADLGSRNKTFVNDIAINTVTPLRPGDRLRVGPFMFQMPGGADPSLSEDDVAGWLTDEAAANEESTVAAGKDTAFLPRPNADSDTTELRIGGSGPAAPAAASPPPAAPEPPAPAVELDPIVAQAADVIRAYWAGRGGRK